MTEKGFGYLDKNLKPLIETIKPKKSDSYILFALGLDRISSQSFLITIGTQLENFWNKVFSDCQCNLIEPERIPQGFYKRKGKRDGKEFKKGDPKPDKIVQINHTFVDGQKRQVDHYVKLVDDFKLYLESKCNLEFDTEKKPESNKKVKEVWLALGADEGAYFNPCLDIVPVDLFNQYAKLGVKIYGVRDIMGKISNCPITLDEYFTYLKEVIAPILVEKGL